MLNILQHTPLWAFLILAVVVTCGVSARFDRVVPVRKAVALPLLMLAWSLWRMLAMPQQAVLITLAWFVSAALAFLCCRKRGWPRGLLLDASAENLYVPGSSLIPLVMGLLFLSHFSSEVIRGMYPAWGGSTPVSAGFALVYGSVSGLFFARAVAIWQLVASRRIAGS